MKIAESPRVEFKRNPLAEVVCQIQFDVDDAVGVLADSSSFLESLGALGYPTFHTVTEQQFTVQSSLDGLTVQQTSEGELVIRHFLSTDGAWRVSICPSFLALTCTKYRTWEGPEEVRPFRDRILEVASIIGEANPGLNVSRLGLRYKDLIERESLGLEGVPWQELIKSFLLGPLATGGLAPNQRPEDSDVVSFQSQAVLRVGSEQVLLQSSLLTSADGLRRAFLIDSDFFTNSELGAGILADREVLQSRLDPLHTHAGSLFRQSIEERLYNALCS